MQRRIRRRPRPVLRPLVAPEGYNDLYGLILRRLALGVSQAEMAGASGIAQSRLSQLERGRIKATPASIARYREALLRCAKHLQAAGRHLDDAERLASEEGGEPRQVDLVEVIAQLEREQAEGGAA